MSIAAGDVYIPNSRVQNFRFEEDMETMRLDLLARGALWEDPRMLPELGPDKEWLRPMNIYSRPIFINGKPRRFDALQGYQDDCWLVSAIEVITLNDKLIKHVVPPNQSFDRYYVGAFHFRIWQLGTWYDVVVDDRLPVFKGDKTLCYVHSMLGNVFWAALLEKAYMKFCTSISDSFGYGSVRGGYIIDALQDLSGGIVDYLVIPYIDTVNKFKWVLNEVYSNKALICLKCWENAGRGLVANHAYSITKVYQRPDNDPEYPRLFLVRIMNPYGHTEWEGNWRDNQDRLWNTLDRELRQKLNRRREDGEFWMDEIDFVKYIETIYICHLGPWQYLHSRQIDAFRWFSATVLTGEWVKYISAGGARLEDRHINPQYKLKWRYPQDDSKSPVLYNVVIELVQKSECGFRDRQGIAFYIYLLENVKNINGPLNSIFFKNNNPLNEPDFSVGFGRAYTISMKLRATNHYCIVPCLEKKNKDSPFLLRVYSDAPFEILMDNIDSQISKSLQTEEQSPNELSEGIKRLFTDVAQGHDEIDWIGLKDILQAAMNPEISYFGMIASFFDIFLDIFEKYILFRSSNHYESGDIVFTKDECRSMIAMLDDNHSGKISFSEFSNLWKKICFWAKVYEQHRDETDGYVRVAQLRDALSSIGYDINNRTVHSLSYVYANEEGNIFLTDFILCGVTLETVLSLCQKEDVDDTKKITFSLEEWVKNTLNM